MEGIGARVGRSSSRYGPAAVFSGPVRKWQKAWVQTSSSSSNNNSRNRTTDDASSHHLLLYKWTPISQASNDSSQCHRKFRYVPVSLVEEEDVPIPNGINVSPVPNMGHGTTDRKLCAYGLKTGEHQASENDQSAVAELSKNNLDLNLGWKAHMRDNNTDHGMLDQSMGWTS